METQNISKQEATNPILALSRIETPTNYVISTYESSVRIHEKCSSLDLILVERRKEGDFILETNTRIDVESLLENNYIVLDVV